MTALIQHLFFLCLASLLLGQGALRAAPIPETCSETIAAHSKAPRFPRTGKVLSFTWEQVNRVHRFVQGQPRVWNHVSAEPNLTKVPFRLYQDWIHPVVRLLSPVWLPKAATPTHPIFRKLWTKKGYEPSPSEYAILDKYKARKLFEEKREFMRKHPYWTIARRNFGRIVEGARAGTVIFALNLLYHQMAGGTPSVDQYLNQPQYQLAAHQVRLLNETVPFPHTAIQIGHRVYSYGQTHLSQSVVNEYLRHREIQKLLEEERIRRGDPAPAEPPPRPGSSAAGQRSSAKGAELIAEAMGLDKLPQSIQAVTLNLTDAEVAKLQKYLEGQVGKQYVNSTMVNDCATMVIRALEENTGVRVSRFIDASPSQISFYFASLKTLGSDQVGPIHQIVVEEPNHPHLARNLYINVVESNLFIELFPFNQLNRICIDAAYTPSTIQHFDPVALKAMEEFRKEYADTVKKDPQLNLWEEDKIPGLIARAQRGENVEERARELGTAINEYLDEQVAQADGMLNTPNLSSLDVQKYRVRKELLQTKRIELLLGLSKTKSPLP